MEVRRLAVVKLIIIKLTVIKQIIMKPMVNQINHNKTGNSPCMTFIGNFLFIKIISKIHKSAVRFYFAG